MSPTVTTFLFEAANFLTLAALLGWLFFQPVSDAIQGRRSAQQQLLDDATKKNADAEQLRSELERKHADFELELERRRDESQAAAQQQAESMMQAVREAAQRETEAAKRRINHLERSKRVNLARVIAEITGTTVDHLLRQLAQPDLEHALTVAACRELQQFGEKSLLPVRVESARPLEQSDRDALIAALGDDGQNAEFHIVEELGMGLRISTNHGLVDASAQGLSSYAQRELSNRLASTQDGSVEANADG